MRDPREGFSVHLGSHPSDAAGQPFDSPGGRPWTKDAALPLLDATRPSFVKGKTSVFEQLRAGLEDSIAHSKGQLSLKTTTLPAPPPRVRASQIVALRKKLRMSQAVFAATLNVSIRTVQSWEQGLREPSDAALRMLQLVRAEPTVVETIFAGAGREPAVNQPCHAEA